MQQLEAPRTEQSRPPQGNLPPGLPKGSQVEHVAFVASDHASQTTLVEFKEPRACRAILSTVSPAAETLPDLTLLLVPSCDLECAELLESVWSWVEPEILIDRRQGQLITLQGTRVIWSPGRAAIIAPAERLETLRLALVEFAFHDGEVRHVERALAQAWPELEADTPLAFKFDDQAALRREDLAQRFEQVVGIRTRLARINPVVHRPALHPPTLAGQLGERLKERTRLVERIEFLGNQLEVFEWVYEMCGQRSSDYAISRKSTTLEWVIIVILALETIVLLVDLLARLGK